MKTNITFCLLLFLSYANLSAQLWSMEQKLGTNDQLSGDNLGISSAISDSFMISGAWWEDHDENGNARISASGSAYIYKLQANGQWQEIQKLVSPNRIKSGYFGFAVDIDGDLALVSAYNQGVENEPAAGVTYVYIKESDGLWTLEDSLIAADALSGDNTGKSLFLSLATMLC